MMFYGWINENERIVYLYIEWVFFEIFISINDVFGDNGTIYLN